MMAQTVTGLWPQAKFAIDPPVAEGSYYDFDVDGSFAPDEVAAIEQRMREIVAEGQPFPRREADSDEVNTSSSSSLTRSS